MNIKRLIIVFLGMLVVACVCSPEKPDAKDAALDVPFVMPECGESGEGPGTIVILATTDEFGIRPPRLCVPTNPDSATVIRVRVIDSGGSDGAVTARIFASPYSADRGNWLSGEGATMRGEEDTFVITIPPGTIGTFLYTVTVKGFGMIDPMVSVQDSARY